MSGLREQLEQECRKYAGSTLRSWLKETYWKWTGNAVLLAEILDTTQGTVRYILDSYDIPARGRGGVCTPKPAKDRLEKDYNAKGMTVRQMGSKYSVSHQTICNWLDSDGIELRKSHRRKNSDLVEA